MEKKDLLVDVIQNLSRAHSIADIAQIVRHAAREIANADGATFVLRDNGFCHYFDEEAIAPLWKGKRFPLEACISGWSMIRGESVSIPDIYQDPRIPMAAYRPTFVKSLLMTPIRKENAIGAIGVYWGHHHQPTPDEVETLQALANSTSVAMENASLHEALQEKIRELEVASKEKDHFLMVLSHELRTPMNSILGWSEMLQSEAGIQPAARSGLASIHRNAVAEMRLITDLLDMSQILTGRMQIEKTPVDLSATIEKLGASVRASTAQKSLNLRFDLDPGLRVVGDKQRLCQIVEALLSNAIKFTPEQGSIDVSLRAHDGDVVLVVSDSGEGIAPEMMSKIFDRFQTQSHESTRQHGGLGLGLAIVKHLVEAHGGQIRASSPGLAQGSTFEVRLPQLQTQFQTQGEPREDNSFHPDFDPGRFRVRVQGRDVHVQELRSDGSTQ